jgi:hypothetical protein
VTADEARQKPKSKLTPRGRKTHIPGGARDTAVVLGLLALAGAAVAAVVLTRGPSRTDAPRAGRTVPDSPVPPRIPYRDLVAGRARSLPDGRVEIVYDFEPVELEDAPFATDADLYPQLDDWSRSIRGSRAKNAVVSGEGRFAGQARTRIAFSGAIEVSAELEIFDRPAAIQVSTDLSGLGYNCQVRPDGTVNLRVRRLRNEEKPEEGAKSTDLCEAAKLPAPAAGRRMRIVFTKTEGELALAVDGVEAARAPLPSPDPFPAGNVALRTTGLARWDDVRITGTLDPEWIEARMAVAVRLTGLDVAEPDDTWSTARELMGGGSEEERTFAPEGDVDWVTVAVPAGVETIAVETHDIHLGITTELTAFGADGRTPIEAKGLESGEPGSAAIAIPTGGASLIYVRVSEPEGRAGVYRLRARPLENAGSDGGADVTPPARRSPIVRRPAIPEQRIHDLVLRGIPQEEPAQRGETALDLDGAERSLLDDDPWRDPRTLRVAKAKYRLEYSQIIKPDYSFLTTKDPQEQKRMRFHAVVRCTDPECTSVLLEWVRRSEDQGFRRVALGSLGGIMHNGGRGIRPRMLRLLLAHLEEDMSLEQFAESLGQLSRFATLPLPDGVLSAWEARATGDSPAAQFVRQTVRSIAANNSVIPGGLDFYPRIKIEGRSFEPEGARK